MRVPNSGLRKSLELATKRYEEAVDLAGAYLEARGITEADAHRFRLGVVNSPAKGHEGYYGRLAIPYITPTGVTTIRFRCLRDHVCKDVGCPKYLGLVGHDPRLYNVLALFEDSERLAILEGEMDTITVQLAGVPAVGYQGVEAWLPEFVRAIGYDYPDIIVPADRDDKGQGLAAAKSIASQLSGRVVKWPDGHDANSLAQERGLDAVREVLL